LFIGAHFTAPNDILFYKAEVDYSYLSDWANLPVTVPAIKSRREYNFSYTCPENISAKIAQGQISVVYRYSSVNDLRHVEFRPSVYLQIEPKMEFSFEDFEFQFIYPINNLLTLATNIPNLLNLFSSFPSLMLLMKGWIKLLPWGGAAPNINGIRQIATCRAIASTFLP